MKSKLFSSLLIRLTAVSMLGAMALTSFNASAQTLEAVKARGKVLIGIQGDNPPFGFLDSQGKNDGYDADVGKLFASELKVPVEFVVVTNQNRIAALQTGKVDVLFATLGMNAERAKALQYSKPYAANQMFLLGKKTAKLDTPATLKGMPVGVPKGSSQESLVAKMAPDAQLRRFDDDSSTIQALLSGQVDAVGANQFYIWRINEQKPGIFENKFPLATNYNGAGTRLGDKAWNSTVNSFIDKMKASGKLNEFYKKWMGFAAPDFATSLEGVPFSVQ